jgi:hypothetical protein
MNLVWHFNWKRTQAGGYAAPFKDIFEPKLAKNLVITDTKGIVLRLLRQ